MQPTVHPEVLARDWLPPVALGRAREVDEVVRRLDPPRPRTPGPWMVAVVGPSGSGTSTIARRAAREVADRVRASVAGAPPRVLSVRTLFLRGSHGVATALLQLLDEGFDGRGFPVPEILAGLLRRLRREGRPSIVVVDDVSLGGPELTGLVRAFLEPDRFLPEGECGMPPLWVIFAGATEALEGVDRALGNRRALAPFVTVAPYPPEVLRSMVLDRMGRAMGHPAPTSAVERIVARVLEDGGGARRAMDLVRRDLLGMTFREVRDGPSASRSGGIPVEPRVVRAIGVASHGKAARLAEVKRLEAELARAQGARPLPTTTLWRRILRLEQAGYVRREIRTGGNGGTLSVVRVLTPVEEWVTTTHPTGSHRGGARPVVPDVLPVAPALAMPRAELGSLTNDP
jgi:hypothetical protein